MMKSVLHLLSHWRVDDTTSAYAVDDGELERVLVVLIIIRAAHGACFAAPLAQTDVVKAVIAAKREICIRHKAYAAHGMHISASRVANKL